MAGLDLTTFKPTSASQLGAGILTQLGTVLGTDLNQFKTTCGDQVAAVASAAWNLQTGLAAVPPTITQAQADVALHTQELALNNVILEANFMAYDLAQQALDTVLAVVTAAIRNLTGVALKF